MASMFSRRIAAWLSFFIGLLLMFLGSAFLLGSLAGTSKFSVLLAFLVVIAGILLAMFAIKMNKSSIYLFFAAFFLMAGFFLFLSALNVIPRDIFYKTWPLISVFSGLALVPAGWRRYGTFRSRFMAPALVFVILGCALLAFSFDIVGFSFKQFILNWWPLLIAFAGLLLVLISLGARNSAGDQDR
ncbi:LiaI-LiaF-like domain-containing protein [Leadbettera azotonutricia]|uniref:Putative membrane protein n=1 Tax=Leadbettera azotonutricia (strain ATCC BAA-888 / DSM 13862 / ZAS-9) TaxID=545695 RepID=F5Y8E8_LEAAZ|nr:DUF5668 domain-containing protein [Leadbettera azotonutricia]AEF82940.1 putative membrane protein [Leadbettera azotonutricia ZAS-9]